ncbi:MAG: hypothetical protein ABII00_13060 [Elusimicrobiota bacterium]
MNTRRIATTLALILAASLAATGAQAKRLAKEDVPEPLKPWIGWVLAGHEVEQCPFLQGSPGRRMCAWPAGLKLELHGKGGRFTQRWKVYEESWIALPGEAKRWPQDVRVGDAPASVILREDRPQLRLKDGKHTVTGSFRWDSLPELLQIPPETGLLALTVRGKPVRFPVRDESGRLWLQKAQADSKEKARLEVDVHRRVTDDIPLRLDTHIRLKVSGKSREVVLGKALPEGFAPLSLTGPLPARVEPDGRLRVQVRAGDWILELAARHEGPADELTPPEPRGPWDAEEVWVFEAQPGLRLVSVEGPPQLDPQQTELPGQWRGFPAYLMRPGDAMKLVERRRGDADPAPDRLSLDRTFWLDFAGRGFTVRDRVSGDLNRSWRLEMAPRTELGRAAVGGRDQFITALEPDGPAGIEVRQGRLELDADSRIERPLRKVPAVSWNADFDNVNGRLNLPPGWRLIHAFGVDKASPTWVTLWTLLDIFLVLIIGLSVGKLWGRRWGALALVTAALTWHEPGAPRWVWLFLLAGEALVRALPEGRFLKAMKAYRGIVWAALLVIAVPFLVLQVKQALYPQLERRQEGVRPLASASKSEAEAFDERFRGKGRAVMRKAMVGGMLAEQAMDFDAAPEAPFEAEGKEFAMRPSSLMAAGGAAPAPRPLFALDPNSQVSTGPGLPTWDWRAVSLSWRGPVKSGQQLRFLLICPGMNFALTLLRVALVVVFALLVFGLPIDRWGRDLRSRGGWAKAAAWLFPALLIIFAQAGAARAEPAGSQGFPTPEMLNELRGRLLENPECAPRCAESPRLRLEVSGNTLRVRVEVNVAAETAVPLPGGVKQWVPTRVLLGESSAPGLRRTQDGMLWIPLPKGSHQVLLEGPLPDRDTVQVPLPLKPRRVVAKVSGWILDGIREDGVPEGNLQLSRVRGAKGRPGSGLEPGALPPFVRVERTLVLGLSWRADTRVIRLTPVGTPIVVPVPLIAGESVTTADVRVAKGEVLVNMGPHDATVRWTSTLKESDSITLEAPDKVPWVEKWRLDVGPLWHAEPEGIPTVHSAGRPQAKIREWRPWPGEAVTVALTRPEGVGGRTLTIDHAALTMNPGLRASDATLALKLRSSRGGQHTLTLPEGAELQLVQIDNRAQPVRQEDRKVTLPIQPGSHSAQLDWRQDGGISLFYRTPEVDLGAESVNADLTVKMPAERWTLLLGGPRLGPAVLFWSLLAVFLLVSVGLGRLRLTPLRWIHWFLLSLGLTQVPLTISGTVAVWLVALGWRKEHAPKRPWAFDGLQASLGLLTLLAFACLFMSIKRGLLGLPDMQIGGNGSSSQLLLWYQDRSGEVLPRAWALSVPLMLYRAAMLAWALWLASSMLKWIKWGWACFTAGGMWRPVRANPKAKEKPAVPKPPAP